MVFLGLVRSSLSSRSGLQFIKPKKNWAQAMFVGSKLYELSGKEKHTGQLFFNFKFLCGLLLPIGKIDFLTARRRPRSIKFENCSCPVCSNFTHSCHIMIHALS